MGLKKKLFLMLFLFLSYQGAFAQQETQRRFSGTIVAGLNASQIDGDKDAGFHKLGFNVGGRAGIYLAKRWEIAMELLFSQKGSQNKYYKGIPRDLQVTLNYVEVPVEAYFKDWEVADDKGSYMRIMIGAGLSYSRLLGGKAIIDGREDDMARFKGNDFMLMATANVFFTRNWGLSVRYSRSFLSIIHQGVWISHQLSFRAMYMF